MVPFMTKREDDIPQREKIKNRLRVVRNVVKDRYHATEYKIASVKTRISDYQDLKRREKESILTESEIEEKIREIKDFNLKNVDLYPFDDGCPCVSIVVLNRDGLEHLRRLFLNFEENIQYPHYEIIVVDNASRDGSLAYLEELKNTLPLRIIKNKENQSFSQANNQAVQTAEGEYILLLNNDVEPLFGWLNHMMQVALQSPQEIGAVGAKLIYPYTANSTHNKTKSFTIQHAGIAFKHEGDHIKPYNRGNGQKPFHPSVNTQQPRAAVTAATLLLEKNKYQEVGGLDEQYHYGYEDVDLSLKLLKKGYQNIYTPQATLLHYEFGTIENNWRILVKRRRLKNLKLFSQKWDKWLYKEFLKDKLNSELVFSEKPLQVAFAVTEYGPDASAGDYFTAYELGQGLKIFDWEIKFLPRFGPENWYDVGEDVDILIAMIDVFDPRMIINANSYLIKVAWLRNWFDRWMRNPGFMEYDMLFTASNRAIEYIHEQSGKMPLLMPIATNLERFNPDISSKVEYECDYCFTGSYWDDPRDIMEMLDPESLPFEFKLYGKNWEHVDKFKKFYQGFLNYSSIPQVYASTKIVVDDANRATKKCGAVNSRVFDALASGALVITNGRIGAEETFQGKLPSFSSKDELNHLINYYLTHEDERKKKTIELQEFVVENHTYLNRAQTFKSSLESISKKH
jgi:GT2 family glycosyltransferase